MPALFLRIEYATVLLSAFLLGALLVLIPALLRQLLDPKASALAALCWPVRSVSLMVGMLCWVLIVLSLMQLLHDTAAAVAIAGLAFLAAVVTPFAAWNPGCCVSLCRAFGGRRTGLVGKSFQELHCCGCLATPSTLR